MTMGDFQGPPFVAGTIVGARSFDTSSDGRLHSPVQNFTWKPGENGAICHYLNQYGISWGAATGSYANDHRPGGDACTCGFYAYFDKEHLDWSRSFRLDALIEGYGRVTVGSRGFRCEKARLVGFVSPYPQPPKVLGLRGRLQQAGVAIYPYNAPIAGVATALTTTATMLAIAGAFWLWPVAVVSLLTLAFTLWSLLGPPSTEYYDRKYRGSAVLTKERWRKVQETYPDVPVFNSMGEAAEALGLADGQRIHASIVDKNQIVS